MKKIYGLLGVAALMTLASCSNDVTDAPSMPGATQGDLYLSMNLRPASAAGSRTSTPGQGSEIGKDYENKVSSALIIFAKTDETDTEGKYPTVFYQALVGETEFKTNNTDYTATFAVDRKAILEDIGEAESKDYQIFVIANPTYDIIQQYQVGATMQQTFKLEADGDTYWTKNHFLMSNADKTAKTIVKADIAPGKCTKEDEAYNLGIVKIQRAMSRIDINKEKVNFTVGDNRDDQYKINLVFDGIALINQATEEFMFKATGVKETEADGSVNAELNKEYSDFMQKPGIMFGTETYQNYVFSPVQTGFTLPLFGSGADYYNSKGVAANGVLTATTYDFNALSYTAISSLNVADDENYEYEVGEEEGAYAPVDDYYVWRYCMENTIFDKDNQVHGASTGIVFRAKLTGPMVEGAEGKAIYAFNNVILGNAEQLKAYAEGTEADNDPGVFEVVKILYHDSKENYKKDNDGEEVADLADLDEYLVANNFSIYRPTMVESSPVYYCYYTYWNRHNDNLQNTYMWPMEFASVRNNVYKISLNTIVRLGHPNNPDDDPDPEDPGTPDEKDSFYCTVLCKVLPWEVRINYVDF